MVRKSGKKSLINCVFCVTVIAFIFLFITGYNYVEAEARAPIVPPGTEDYVAELTIFSCADIDNNSSSSLNISGHAFLSLQSYTFSSIRVGKMTVNYKKSVTIGTWGNKSQHKGIWYNLENYYVNVKNEYNGRISTEMLITAEELDIINDYIKNNDSWSYTTNCSSFAMAVWNSVSPNKVSCGSINTPANLYNSIKQYHNCINKTILYNDNIGYCDNNIFVRISEQTLQSTLIECTGV